MADEKELKDFVVQAAVYKTTYTKKFENRVTYTSPNPNEIYSHIPGTIIDILVKTNQKIKEGETILLLEAMKMENRITMPFDGEIVKFIVKKGDRIPNHHLMLVVKPT
jgi:biotin carboxyl carrier protein